MSGHISATVMKQNKMGSGAPSISFIQSETPVHGRSAHIRDGSSFFS